MDEDQVKSFILGKYNTWTTEQIALHLGISPQAVARKAKRYGVANKSPVRKPGKRKKYSHADEELIKNNILSKGSLWVSQKLNRSEESVKSKAKRMGLSIGEKYVWPPEDIKLLMDNFDDMSYQELGRLIGKTGEAVRKFARSKGMLKQPEKA